MAPHEFAQALHNAAVTLENDGELYKKFTAIADRSKQRSALWDALSSLDQALKARLQMHNGVVAAEQLRRYLVDVWDVTTDDEKLGYRSYRDQPTIKFWMDEVNQPPRSPLDDLLKAQQETLDNIRKTTAESTSLYDQLTKDLNALNAKGIASGDVISFSETHIVPGRPVMAPTCKYAFTQKETTMSKIIDIETKTFVNGINVTTMTNAQVFDLIAEQEAAIAKLEGIQAKPKLLVKEIEERKAGIAALVAHLDAKAE